MGGIFIQNWDVESQRQKEMEVLFLMAEAAVLKW